MCHKNVKFVLSRCYVGYFSFTLLPRQLSLLLLLMIQRVILSTGCGASRVRTNKDRSSGAGGKESRRSDYLDQRLKPRLSRAKPVALP